LTTERRLGGFSWADSDAGVLNDPEVVFDRFLREHRNSASEKIEYVVLVLPTRTEDQETWEVEWGIGPEVGESSIQRHENAVFLLAPSRYCPIGPSLQVLIKDGLRVVTRVFQELGGLPRGEIFVDLKVH
jgi:hypothetical protein